MQNLCWCFSHRFVSSLGATYWFEKQAVTYRSVCLHIHMMVAPAPRHTEQEDFHISSVGQTHKQVLPTYGHACCYLSSTVHPRSSAPLSPKISRDSKAVYPHLTQKLQIKITVPISPMPECTHSLQGILSNTPKPQIMRSPRMPN